MCNLHADHLIEGIPCTFFNFKGQYSLEVTIRKLLAEVLCAKDTSREATAKTILLFKEQHIENVVWSYDGYAIFWYVGER